MANRTVRARRRHAHYIGKPDESHVLDRLGARVVVMGDCWVVDGNTDKYPTVEVFGKSERANRYIWRNTHGVGRLRSSIHIHHTCEVPGCINPNHLVALTNSDHKRVHAGTINLADVVLGPGDNLE